MSLNLGEMFLSLGIKGADKTVQSLNAVEKGFKSVYSAGMQNKVMIAAVIYGLQRMSAASGREGTALNQFAVATGLSSQALQKWQYMANRFNVEGSEVQSTLMGMQSSLIAMSDSGDTGPLGRFAKFGVNVDASRLRDTMYMFNKYQEFAKKAPPDVARHILAQLGISDKVFQFLRANDMRMNQIKNSDIFSLDEIKNLDKVNKLWAEYERLVMIGTGRLNAAFAPDIIQSVTILTQEFFKLTEQLIILEGKYQMFDKFSKGIGSIADFTREVNEKGFLSAMGGRAEEGTIERSASDLMIKMQQQRKNQDYFKSDAFNHMLKPEQISSSGQVKEISLIQNFYGETPANLDRANKGLTNTLIQFKSGD